MRISDHSSPLPSRVFDHVLDSLGDLVVDISVVLGLPISLTSSVEVGLYFHMKRLADGQYVTFQ
jgi:hypothetical protein